MSSPSSGAFVVSLTLLSAAAGGEAALWAYGFLTPGVRRGVRQCDRVLLPLGVLSLIIGLIMLAFEQL